MNKQQLATKIWEAANKMRSKIEANDYKDYILGFIFYKFLSDKLQRHMLDQGARADQLPVVLVEKDAELVDYLQNNLGYFMSYKDLFSTWINAGSDFDISHVRDALSAFSRLIGKNHKRVFDGIFDTLQTGLSKLGDSAQSQTKAVRDLIYLINDIPTDGRQDYDVLGFIYEYLISNFAANAGKKAGEFYTPNEVSQLMSRIVADHLKDRDKIEIYDPTSGSGSLLINIGSAAARHMDDPDRIKYYAQELKQNTYNLTRMNLVMRGIKPVNIVTRNADTLEDDWPYFEDDDPVGTYEPLYVDAVVSNPPYSQAWDPENKESDPRFARFGLAPKSKADYAFLLHDLFHLKANGIMTIVLPHGVLFRGGEEGNIRKNLIESNHIDAVIGLPPNIFFGTGIPTIIMVLKQKRDNTDVLIVDASKGFAKVGKNNVLRASDIRHIVDVVSGRVDVEKYSRSVSREEIRENDYNLNIPRYVDSSEPAETWDVYSSMFGGISAQEIDQLDHYWKALPGLREALFHFGDHGYAEVVSDDVGDLISEHPSVIQFKNLFSEAFAGFKERLVSELVDDPSSVRIPKQEDALAKELFDRLNPVPLVDEYQAFQLLYEQWSVVSLDLEMIQTEGSGAIRKVEPNMVMKKSRGKDVEVQDGWAGRILPFELVQEELLHDQSAALKDIEARLTEVNAEVEEIVESLSEEDKTELSEALNDDNTAFMAGPMNRWVRELRKSGEIDELEDDSALMSMVRVHDLSAEKRSLNKELKRSENELHSLTKSTIEKLTDEQVDQLLTAKWVTPLVDQLAELPDLVLADLTDKVTALAKKYETTFAQLENEITEAENELSMMLDDLVGSDTDMQALAHFKDLLVGDFHE